MGNVNGRDECGDEEDGSNIGAVNDLTAPSDLMADAIAINNNNNHHHRTNNTNNSNNTPPHSPSRSASPLLFAPQVPIAPLQRADGPPFLNQMWRNDSIGVADQPLEQGIPMVISWNYGGNEVFVEGSWDNWTTRKQLQRSGKDCSILLVLPSGIYHYKFIVDGEWRYIPDLPCVADESGNICNLLDVNDYVPEILDSVSGFEAPPSPDSTYSQTVPTEEDFAKEPLGVPQQLHLTVLGVDPNEASSSKPQHVVLNHLFIEKGWASQSLVALGLTHRFQSKYVTVVLYKPLKR
ncbi:SNF1-related protein kinase regulatory subunit beta-1 [Mercurialis annua]|uniref:SNF1-related protein kinase regulatory subunit beta-1 n=1 Tax=Mercurialis annua TaxID=3986 RepID=UPI00215F6EB8|nr:SNF1-related protein kinase regulatory subunit beta-1 [Mercurialis annua]